MHTRPLLVLNQITN